MKIGERLKLVLDERKIPLVKLETEAGLANGYASLIVRNMRPELGPTMIRKISSYLRIRPEWLAFGEGPMTADAPSYHPAFPELRKALEFREGQYPAERLRAFHDEQTARPGAKDHARDQWDKLIVASMELGFELTKAPQLPGAREEIPKKQAALSSAKAKKRAK